MAVLRVLSGYKRTTEAQTSKRTTEAESVCAVVRAVDSCSVAHFSTRPPGALLALRTLRLRTLRLLFRKLVSGGAGGSICMTRISTPKHAREPTQETEGQESLETYRRGWHTQEYETDYAGQGLLPERWSPLHMLPERWSALHMSCQDHVSAAQSEHQPLVGLRAQEAASFAFKEAGQEREVETIPHSPL